MLLLICFLPLFLSVPYIVDPINDQFVASDEEFTFQIPSDSFGSSDDSSIGYSISSSNDFVGYYIEDLQLESSVPYLVAVDIVTHGNLTFIGGATFGVGIFDTSNFSHPILISSIHPKDLHDSAFSVSVHEDFLYVGITKKSEDSNSEGFKIYDISDPSNPFRMGSSSVISNNAMFTKRIIARTRKESKILDKIVFTAFQEYLFGVGRFNYFKIHNATNPSSPVEIGCHESIAPSSSIAIEDFFVDENLEFVYLAVGVLGLRILDISSNNIRSPLNISVFNNFTESYKCTSVAVKGDICYVGLENRGMAILNVSDRSTPKLLNEFVFQRGAYSLELVKNQDYMLVPRGFEGILVLDLHSESDPSNPTIEWTGSTEVKAVDRVSIGYVGSTAVSMFAASDTNGMKVFDISDITSPKESAHYRPDGPAAQVLVVNNTLFVANEDNRMGIRVYDISDRKNPVFTSELDLKTESDYLFMKLTKDKKFIFLTTEDTGLFIIDISDHEKLQNPVISKYYRKSKFPASYISGFSTFFDDQLLIVVENMKTGIFNVSDRYQDPVRVGSVPKDSMTSMLDRVAVYNDSIAYVARFNFREMEILDISNRTHPKLLSLLDGGGSGFYYDCQIPEGSESLFVISSSPAGISVYDISSNQTNPNITKFVPVASADSMFYTPDAIYVAKKRQGFNVLGLKQDYKVVGSNPDLMETDVLDLFQESNYLYAAVEEGGFHIYRGELQLFERSYFCGNVTVRMNVFDGSGELPGGYSFNISRKSTYTQPDCSGHGTCNLETNKCDCLTNFVGEKCETLKCECNGHGTCSDWGECSCFSEYYGERCSVTKCHGLFSNDTSGRVCSGHGTCWDKNCDCDSHYFGEYCNITTCSGRYWNNDTSSDTLENICSGRGRCPNYQNCSCFDEKKHWGRDCEVTSCNNISSDASVYLVCSGHGRCVNYDKCECLEGLGYTGSFCQYPICFGIGAHNQTVCGGHGSCIYKNKCSCIFGYSSSSLENGDGVCDTWYCLGISHTETEKVCSGKGTCQDYNKCVCREGYAGLDCEDWRCFGFHYEDRNLVCNGNGDCEEPEKCECGASYVGDACETNVVLLSTLIPIASIGVIGLVGCVFLVLVVFCLVLLSCSCVGICLVCVGLCCVCCCLVCLCCVVVKQTFGLRKFKKLKNFDLLLKEQEMEEDVSIAHLKFNKKLFEVDLSEIQTIKILGEGGSNSIVFEASWRNQRVAFKCFKTRSVCSNQESFEEFEHEVQLLSSLSHPNIIRFFGACLNPPRVGIIMEYCPNGELLEFIQNFREKHGMFYPIYEKFRLLREVTSALDYIHSRNIIHRDLKSENVLVSADDRAKLMDFGLSRLVESMSIAKTTRIGTSVYMAPEIVLSTKYTHQCDVFSLAMLIFVCVTENVNPYGKRATLNLEIKVANNPDYRPKMSQIDEAEEEKIPMNVRKPLKKLIRRCWDHEIDVRYSCEEILKILGELGEYKGQKEKKVELEKKKELEEDENSTSESSSETSSETSSSLEDEGEEEKNRVEVRVEDKNKNKENKMMKNRIEELEEEVSELLEVKEEMEKLKIQNRKLKKKVKKMKKKLDENNEEEESNTDEEPKHSILYQK